MSKVMMVLVLAVAYGVFWHFQSNPANIESAKTVAVQQCQNVGNIVQEQVKQFQQANMTAPAGEGQQTQR